MVNYEKWLNSPTIIKGELSSNEYSLTSKYVCSIIDSRILNILNRKGYKKLFPVQVTVLEEMFHQCRKMDLWMRPCDLCICSPTGSGKTLAYVLPIVQSLARRPDRQLRALVVLPTTELAQQVYGVFMDFAFLLGLCVNLSSRHSAYGFDQNKVLLERADWTCPEKADILVTTPGFLNKGILSGSISLKSLEFLVADEADRLIAEFQCDWLSQIETHARSDTLAPSWRLNTSRSMDTLCVNRRLPYQKLFVSATLDRSPDVINQLDLFEPRLIADKRVSYEKENVSLAAPLPVGLLNPVEMEVDEKYEDGESVSEQTADSKSEMDPLNKKEVFDDARESFKDGQMLHRSTPEGLSEFYVKIDSESKPLYLLHFLVNLRFKRVLCFTNSVESAHRLTTLLNLFFEHFNATNPLRIMGFSSSLTDQKRSNILRQFEGGTVDVLVCSDALSRGIDISDVRCVINYDMAPSIEAYMHRVGRTARAGKAGLAFSLLDNKQATYLTKALSRLSSEKKNPLSNFKVAYCKLAPMVDAYKNALSALSHNIKNLTHITKMRKLSSN